MPSAVEAGVNRKIGIAALVLITAWAFWPLATNGSAPGERVSAAAAYNPVLEGETLPAGFRQLLPRDAIEPVYEPHFVAAHEIAWSGDTQVIGVVGGDDAKAYPVSYLNQREMVIDSIAGIPILVTW